MAIRGEHTILVCTRQTALSTQRITLSRAQVVDLHHDGLGTLQCITRTIGLWGQLPAGAARRAGALSRAGTEKILGSSSIKARAVVKSAGSRGSVAAAGAGTITSAVFRERGFVGLCVDGRDDRSQEENGGCDRSVHHLLAVRRWRRQAWYQLIRLEEEQGERGEKRVK